jgi:pyruvate formate lyase activating enzyme
MENEGLVFDIRRFSVHDGPGIRTTVFLKGCPLSCWWCHNPESQEVKSEETIKNYKLSDKLFQQTEITGKFMSVAEVMQEVIRDQVFYEESKGGVTFSGGEPLMQESFLRDLLKSSKSLGLHTALDTSGYATLQAIQYIAPWVDLFLFDVKIINDQLHQQYTGVSNVTILANLRYLVQNRFKVILRFPVIPGITDTMENISYLKELLKSLLPLHPITIDLLPYHDSARNKYCRLERKNKLPDLRTMKPENLLMIAKEIELTGIQVRLGG